MRKNFGAKAICYPMPVFIIGTYNANGTPNAMNAAWGGISEEQEITICVDSAHKTAENLKEPARQSISAAQEPTPPTPTTSRCDSLSLFCFSSPNISVPRCNQLSLIFISFL